ncbi:MAG: type I secretion system permease/ATPase [Alphaproteobacteria bacterium]
MTATSGGDVTTPPERMGENLAAAGETAASARPAEAPGTAGAPLAPPEGADDPALAGAPSEAAAKDWDVSSKMDKPDDPLLACLATLTKLLERPMSASALVAGLPMPEAGMTPEFFIRAATHAGINARLARRSLRKISNLTLPCVLLLKEQNACVLLRLNGVESADVIFADAGDDVRRVSQRDLLQQYLGYVLFTSPESRVDGDAFDTARPFPKAWFWGTLWKFWPIYGEVAIAAFLINLFALATPLFIMNVYDRVVPNNAIETLWVLALGVGIVFAFDFLLRVLRNYFADVAGRGADTLISSRMFQQVMGMRMASRPQSAGALASHLREFETLRDFFTSATLTTMIDLPFVFIFIAMIWYVGGPLAYVPLVAAPLVFLVGLGLQIPLNIFVRRAFSQAAEKHGILFEVIGGLETLKSMGAEGRMQRRWEQCVGETAKSGAQVRSLSTVAISFAAFSQNMVTVGIVIFGVYRIAEGYMTVGALVAATILAGRTMAPLAQVAGIATRFQQARAALKALDKIMTMPTERPDARAFVHRPGLNGDIEFKNVVFSYPGQKSPVLNDLSFRIKAGERVGVIGRIGSGKSTIERLILGLYEPASGAVLVDGTDVRQIDPADLRRNIGCVPQETVLFAGSVRDNITLSAPNSDDAAVLRAARIAGVEEFTRLHPQGFDMPVGERGEAISGGQRQAVAVARSVLADRPIFIMDEPTSAMDSGAENQFKIRLQEVIDGKTLVLITHRASLLSLVDRLIVIDGGKVVADGPRESVLKRLANKDIRTSGA